MVHLFGTRVTLPYPVGLARFGLGGEVKCHVIGARYDQPVEEKAACESRRRVTADVVLRHGDEILFDSVASRWCLGDETIDRLELPQRL